jgi:hypothetical protein
VLLSSNSISKGEQYLLENDKELLEFNEDQADDASMDGEEEATDGPTVLTLPMLAEWQKALVSVSALHLCTCC